MKKSIEIEEAKEEDLVIERIVEPIKEKVKKTRKKTVKEKNTSKKTIKKPTKRKPKSAVKERQETIIEAVEKLSQAFLGTLLCRLFRRYRTLAGNRTFL